MSSMVLAYQYGFVVSTNDESSTTNNNNQLDMLHLPLALAPTDALYELKQQLLADLHFASGKLRLQQQGRIEISPDTLAADRKSVV